MHPKTVPRQPKCPDGVQHLASAPKITSVSIINKMDSTYAEMLTFNPTDDSHWFLYEVTTVVCEMQLRVFRNLKFNTFVYSDESKRQDAVKYVRNLISTEQADFKYEKKIAPVPAADLFTVLCDLISCYPAEFLPANFLEAMQHFNKDDHAKEDAWVRAVRDYENDKTKRVGYLVFKQLFVLWDKIKEHEYEFVIEMLSMMGKRKFIDLIPQHKSNCYDALKFAEVKRLISTYYY